MKEKPVIIIGAGGHARVLIGILQQTKARITGILVKDNGRGEIWGVKVLGGDDCLSKYPPDKYELVNGVGSTGDLSARKEIFIRFNKMGYAFRSIIHPKAILAGGAVIGEGTQVMAGAIVQPGVQIGQNCIINTGSSIDHDCAVGNHVHVAPGAVISGCVRINEGSHIGVGAVLIQGVHIGSGCLINAGAVVTGNVPDKHSASGNPAKLKSRKGMI